MHLPGQHLTFSGGGRHPTSARHAPDVGACTGAALLRPLLQPAAHWGLRLLHLYPHPLAHTVPLTMEWLRKRAPPPADPLTKLDGYHELCRAGGGVEGGKKGVDEGREGLGEDGLGWRR